MRVTNAMKKRGWVAGTVELSIASEHWNREKGFSREIKREKVECIARKGLAVNHTKKSQVKDLGKYSITHIQSGYSIMSQVEFLMNNLTKTIKLAELIGDQYDWTKSRTALMKKKADSQAAARSIREAVKVFYKMFPAIGK